MSTRHAALILTMAAGIAVAQPHPLAGAWAGPSVRLDLRIAGTDVSGTCRQPDGKVAGTVSGVLLPSGRGLTATLTWPADSGLASYRIGLMLHPKAVMVNGFRWDDGVDVPTAIGLRRDEPLMITPAGPRPPTPPTTPTAPPATTTNLPSRVPLGGAPTVLFRNENGGGVRPNPTVPTVVTLARPAVIATIETYHYNGGKGATPGTIALRAADGTVYGPWRTTGRGDAQGRKNLYWVADVSARFAAGQYTIVDSEPATWGTNDAAGSRGFATVTGVMAPEVKAGPVITLYDNSNGGAISNRPTKPTVFTLARPARLTYLRTYHYNGGNGAKPGTLSLAGPGGKTYGPWQAVGTGASGGRLPIMWVVEPMVELPAGTYTVLDSDPATWSQNAQSSGTGIAWVSGSPHD